MKLANRKLNMQKGGTTPRGKLNRHRGKGDITAKKRGGGHTRSLRVARWVGSLKGRVRNAFAQHRFNKAKKGQS